MTAGAWPHTRPRRCACGGRSTRLTGTVLLGAEPHGSEFDLFFADCPACGTRTYEAACLQDAEFVLWHAVHARVDAGAAAEGAEHG